MGAGSTSTGVRRVVLHALRLTSLASAEVVARRLDLPVADVEDELRRCAGSELVRERSGRLAGWSLTPEGRAEAQRLLSDELDDLGARSLVESSYERFLTVNGSFLDVCTRWQLREVDGESIPNDHADPAHDEATVGALAELHQVVVGVVDELAAQVVRFGGYRPRFEYAFDRVCAHDVEWFTRPLIDSYHTVWFELHGDLLATLGRTRTSEHAGG